MIRITLASALGSIALAGALTALALPSASDAASAKHLVGVNRSLSITGPTKCVANTGGVWLWENGPTNSGWCGRYTGNVPPEKDLTVDYWPGCNFNCDIGYNTSSISTVGSSGNGFLICGDYTSSGFVSGLANQGVTASCNDNSRTLHIN